MVNNYDNAYTEVVIGSSVRDVPLFLHETAPTFSDVERGTESSALPLIPVEQYDTAKRVPCNKVSRRIKCKHLYGHVHYVVLI